MRLPHLPADNWQLTRGNFPNNISIALPSNHRRIMQLDNRAHRALFTASGRSIVMALQELPCAET